jgi:hypothetical protein
MTALEFAGALESNPTTNRALASAAKRTNERPVNRSFAMNNSSGVKETNKRPK